MTYQYKREPVSNRGGRPSPQSRPCTPHVLRHTFSVVYLHRGGSTKALQLMLGHDHLFATEIYLNLSPEDVLAEFHVKW